MNTNAFINSSIYKGERRKDSYCRMLCNKCRRNNGVENNYQVATITTKIYPGNSDQLRLKLVGDR